MMIAKRNQHIQEAEMKKKTALPSDHEGLKLYSRLRTWKKANAE